MWCVGLDRNNVAPDSNLGACVLDSWGALSRGVRGAGRKVDHSPLSSLKFTNEWIYAYISPYVFMASTGTAFT